MRIAKVIGSVVATQKEVGLVGTKLMIIRYQTKDGEVYGDEEVAVDFVGAGIGELVLIAKGSATRTRDEETKTKPIDLAIVGIIDTII